VFEEEGEDENVEEEGEEEEEEEEKAAVVECSKGVKQRGGQRGEGGHNRGGRR
jgi:hypothetical protein